MKGYNLFWEYANENCIEYDTVIVGRFDLNIHSFPIIHPQGSEVWIPIGPNSDSPEYHYGGIRDLMAIATPISMSYFCDLFKALEYYHSIGVGLHPESILRKHLEEYGSDIKRFPMESSLRGNPVL